MTVGRSPMLAAFTGKVYPCDLKNPKVTTIFGRYFGRQKKIVYCSSKNAPKVNSDPIGTVQR